MKLNERQRRFFESEGYLTGLKLFETEEADRVRSRFDALEAEMGREKSQIGLIDTHFEQEFVWRLATRPPLLDALESLIGPDVLLLATHFFCKYGGGEKFVAWHQDVTYWGLEPPEAWTAWLAIDDSDRENGCMRVLPGTHRGGIRTHGTASTAGNLLSINQEVPVTEAEERSAVDLVLMAGELSIHHGALVHGSLPNRSHRRRCGVTLRYIAPQTRPVSLNSQGKSWSAVLVRGEDRFHRFGDTDAPF